MVLLEIWQTRYPNWRIRRNGQEALDMAAVGHRLNLLHGKSRLIQYYEASLCVRLLHLFLFLQNMDIITDSTQVHIALSINLFHERSENLLLLTC